MKLEHEDSIKNIVKITTENSLQLEYGKKVA